MTVYLDGLRRWEGQDKVAAKVGERHQHRWCHMIADTEQELHAMAERIGLRRAWFQPDDRGGHYDLTPPRRLLAIAAGAVELERAAFVRMLRIYRAERARRAGTR